MNPSKVVTPNRLKKVAEVIELPVIDISSFIGTGKPDLNEAKNIVEGLHKYGALAIRDPRVDESGNTEFLNMMEKYFESRSKIYYAGQPLADAHPEFGYQVGVTPENKEIAREHSQTIEKFFKEDPPVTPQPPPSDGKWRFFWRIGELEEQDAKLLAPQVIPSDFPEWETKMNRWGGHMYDAVRTASEAIALGLDLDRKTFSSMMDGGVQLLAPTGSDLEKYSQKNDILAGFHYDLNFITIHGKSKFPGLYIWLRNGEKRAVKVPDGCLLIQAAKQLEYLTAGYFYAGFHEVIVSDATLEKAEEARKHNRSTWRVSSTLFSGFNYKHTLQPLPKFQDLPTVQEYPPISVYKFVEEELKAINLLA